LITAVILRCDLHSVGHHSLFSEMIIQIWLQIAKSVRTGVKPCLSY